MKASIEIRIRPKVGRTRTANIDVEYSDWLGEIKVKEIGELISITNPKVSVEVAYLVFSDISNTWMEMFAYRSETKEIIVFS
jgi:hypothetical protein